MVITKDSVDMKDKLKRYRWLDKGEAEVKNPTKIETHQVGENEVALGTKKDLTPQDPPGQTPWGYKN